MAYAELWKKCNETGGGDTASCVLPLSDSS